MSKKYFIGVSGWSHPEWKGAFLPEKLNPTISELQFYSRFFNVVETATTFYHPQSADASRRWLEETAHRPDFRFVVKLWQKLVEEQSPYELEDVQRVCSGLDVLLESGKLGALLLAFPAAFDFSLENRSWLFRLKTTFKKYPIVAELQHASWSKKDAQIFLGEQAVHRLESFSTKHVEDESHGTQDVRFFRLAGLNSDESELREFLAEASKSFANENFLVFSAESGVASVKAAFQARAEIEKQKVVMPKEMLLAEPDLLEIGMTEHTDQLDFFDAFTKRP